MLEVHLCHLKYIIAISQEYIPSFTILGHILIFTFFESFQFSRIIAFYPTSLVQTYRFPTARSIILVQQTILDDLKLQLSDCTDNLATVELIDKQLRHTFIHQLVDTFCQLFLLHRIGILNILEHLRREAGQSAEMEQFSFCQCISDLKSAIIRQADNISCIGFVNGRLPLCHKLGRR